MVHTPAAVAGRQCNSLQVSCRLSGLHTAYILAHCKIVFLLVTFWRDFGDTSWSWFLADCLASILHTCPLQDRLPDKLVGKLSEDVEPVSCRLSDLSSIANNCRIFFFGQDGKTLTVARVIIVILCFCSALFIMDLCYRAVAL